MSDNTQQPSSSHQQKRPDQQQQQQQQQMDSSRASVTFNANKLPLRGGNVSPPGFGGGSSAVAAAAAAPSQVPSQGNVNAFFMSSLQQQQPQHVASSSVAATEGSPPSSPRSTFSSVHSYGHETFSPGIPAVAGSIDLSVSRAAAEAEAAAPRVSLGAESVVPPVDGCFGISVSLPETHFCCAHFVAYKGYRERLHGHNYSVSAKLLGSVGSDGYVLNFCDVKRTLREVCKSLHEYTIIPMRSDVLEITQEGASIHLRCEDGAEFILPRTDCLCLPIVHSTAEEISAYIWQRVADSLSEGLLKKRGITCMEISVYEKATQKAVYRRTL